MDDKGMSRFDFASGAVEIRTEDTIGMTLARAGVSIDHPCGGRGRCGKCLVLATPAAEATEAEKKLLSPERLAEGWRLSCQSPAVEGMCVSYTDGRQGDRILVGGASEGSHGFAPAEDGKYRLGVDIGTTTVVVYLLDPLSGKIAATASAGNSQAKYGADVISRIFAVDSDLVNLKLLKDEIIDTVNGLIGEVVTKAGISASQIGIVHAAGNTTMEHLFLGEDPRSIGRSPFTPLFLRMDDRNAAELGLALDGAASVRLVPNISAFIGGDITAGLYHIGAAKLKGVSLFIDIGTNSEMAICRDGEFYSCSAAAGPALEGAQISTGMRAARGAVEKAAFDGEKFVISTINDTPPVGLCGLGIIDLIAVLLDCGAILPNGKFAAAENVIYEDMARRLRRGAKNFREFVYCFKGELGAERELVLTQKDVCEVQLAKSAIAVGENTLLEIIGTGVSGLDRVYFAGAFGNYIDRRNAMRMGILPKIPPEKILTLGNSARLGVCESAFDPKADVEFRYIENRCKSLNLAALGDFQQQFLKHLNFDA